METSNQPNQPPARAGTDHVYVASQTDLKWIDASRPGLRLAPVHENRETGRFLGLLGFETMASSGLHHHVDIAFSYMLSGGLTDYAGTAGAGQMGINMPGATHDAIAYLPTLMASRLGGRDCSSRCRPPARPGRRPSAWAGRRGRRACGLGC